ncbi:hypothetical protein IFR05_000394 [Cadophora sp. M221]|nr:hypothetical protein IFR05_000394 [Cadophora sp. M221]
MATGVAFEGYLQEVIAETKNPSLVPSSTTTISSLAKECVKRYDTLCTILRETDSETDTAHGFVRDDVLIRIQDARPRFKAWATNIAALQEGHLKSSLDFRLREAEEVRSRVLKILDSLKESLNEAELIITGVQGNKTWEVGAMSDSSFNSDFGSEFSSEESDTGSVNEKLETSELDELLSAIKMGNSSLLDISIVIRNTPNRDDYVKAAARYSLDSHWDISHVGAKFGSAKRSSDWLIQRLGKSITRRRQYLVYRKKHHDKLSKDWNEPLKEVATTYVEALPAPPKDGSELGSFETETSYQQTVAGETEEHILTVPPPPAEAFEGVPFEFGHPFQCPYCWTEQNVKGRNAWKKHVFRDLRPYVCTFKECNLRMFRSRNEWFAHELQAHRREWTCATCSKLFSSKTSFKSHLLWHSPTLAGSELDALILQSEEPMDRFPASACTFCDEWEEQIMNPSQNEKRAFLNDGKDVAPYGTKTQFRRHLGRHMEQLALFALPRDNLDDVEDDSDKEIRGEVIGDDSDASTGTTASINHGEVTTTREYFHDDIDRIRKELPDVKIEVSEMGAGGRTYITSLMGPWGASATMVPIEVTVVFAEQYLDFDVPKFELHSAQFVTDDYLFLKQQVREIADSFAARPRDCLKGVLTYILGRAEFVNGTLIYKKDTAASNDDPSATDFADPWMDAQTLHYEILRLQRERPEVTFDNVDLLKRNVIITMMNIRIEIDFPEAYPKSEIPTFTVSVPASSSSSLPDDFSTKFVRGMIEKAELCLARNEGCLENVFAYIMSVLGEASPEGRGILLKEGKAASGIVIEKIKDDASDKDDDSLTSARDSEGSKLVASQVGPETWQDEVSHVRNQLPQFDITVSQERRSVRAILLGPSSSRFQDASQMWAEDLISEAYQAGKEDVMTEISDIDHFDQDPEQLGILEQHHRIGMPSKDITSENTSTIQIIFYAAPLIRHDLLTIFQPFGQILGVRIPYKERFAYMKFLRREDAQRAITEMDKYLFNGHSLDVDFATTSWTEKLEQPWDSNSLLGNLTTVSNPLSPELTATLDRVIEGREVADDDWAKWVQDIVLDPESPMHAMNDDLAQDKGKSRAENEASRADPGIEPLDSVTQTDNADKEPSPPPPDQTTVHEMLKMQLEYYFSQENLTGDIYLRRHMDEQGSVYLDFIANFQRIQSLTQDIGLLRSICLDSDIIDIAMTRDGKYRVRAKEGWGRWILPKEERVEDLQVQDLQVPLFSHGSVTGVRRKQEIDENIYDPGDFAVEAARQQFLKAEEDSGLGTTGDGDETEETESIETNDENEEEFEQQRIEEANEESEALVAARKRLVAKISSVGEPSSTSLPTTIRSYIFNSVQQQTGALTGLRSQIMLNDRMDLIFNIIDNLRLVSQDTATPQTLQRIIDRAINDEKDIFDTSPNKESYKIRIQMKLEQLEAPIGNQPAVAVAAKEIINPPRSDAQQNSETNIKDPKAWAAKLEEYKDILRDSLRKEESLAVESYEAMLKSIGLVLDASHQERMYRTIADDRVAAINKYEAASQSAIASAAVAPNRMSWEELLEIARRSQVFQFRTSQARFRAMTVSAHEASGVTHGSETDYSSATKIGRDLQNDATHSQPPADMVHDEVAYNPEESASPAGISLDSLEEDIKLLANDIDEEIRASLTRHAPMISLNAILTPRFKQARADWIMGVEELKGEAIRTYQTWHSIYRNSNINTATDNKRRRDAVLRNFISELKLEEAKLGEALKEWEFSRQKSENNESKDDSMRAGLKSKAAEEEEQQRISPIEDLDKPARSRSIEDFAERNEVPGTKESEQAGNASGNELPKKITRDTFDNSSINPALDQVTIPTTSASDGSMESANNDEYIEQRKRELNEFYKQMFLYGQLDSDPAMQAEFLRQQEPEVADAITAEIENRRQDVPWPVEKQSRMSEISAGYRKSRADDNLKSDNQEQTSPVHSRSDRITLPDGAGLEHPGGGETFRSSTSVEVELPAVESRETRMRDTGAAVPMGEDDMEVPRFRERSSRERAADQDGEDQTADHAQADNISKRRAASPPRSDYGSIHDIDMSSIEARDIVDISNSDEPETSTDKRGSKDWESIKVPFFKLYVQQDRPLREVRAILEETHGFVATERMFKRRVRYWNFDSSKGIREMARSLEVQQILSSIENNKPPEEAAVATTEKLPTTATADFEDRAAWEIKFETEREFWFKQFDLAIARARKLLLGLDESSDSGNHNHGIPLSRLYAWQKDANELQNTACRQYTTEHEFALKSMKKVASTGADRKSWRARLWDVGDGAHKLLRENLSELQRQEHETAKNIYKAKLGINRQNTREEVEGSSTTKHTGEDTETEAEAVIKMAIDHPDDDATQNSRTKGFTHGKAPEVVDGSSGSAPVTVQPNEEPRIFPPCNTLIVSNLPREADEDELKGIFSRQQGYKRMLFRTKEITPMCYVEFDDVPSADEALHALQGKLLHNSIHGGIQLGYSKNPLGVRSKQTAVDHTQRWTEAAETSLATARFEAGRGLSQLTSRRELDQIPDRHG